MSAPIIAFFNIRGGVGTTTLVYHLAWMFSDLGVRVLAADLDPQADLTMLCVGEDWLELPWRGVPRNHASTIYQRVANPSSSLDENPWRLGENLHLLPGDLLLASWEDQFASSGEITSSFAGILPETARICLADVVLVDLGPSLGAINHAALLAADYFVVPLAADLISARGMQFLGLAVQGWKQQWERTVDIRPLGYVVKQHAARFNRPVRSYEGYLAGIPGEFQRSVLGNTLAEEETSVKDDPWCLALLKHYHSLMPMAQEAQKPIFHLKVADGAIGSHFQAAQSVGQDFKRLAERIAKGAGIKLPYLSDSVA